MLIKSKKKSPRVRFQLKIDKRLGKALVILFIFLLLGAFLFYFKHLFVVALVGRQPITRYALDRELEKQAGRQILDNLISKTLILQEAGRQKITIGQEETEAKMREIEEQLGDQGTSLDNLLQIQGQTREELEEQIKIELMIEKILGREISVSEKDLENYFEENKQFLPEDATFEEMKGDLEEQLKQKTLQEKFQPWLEELKQKTKIYNFFKP